MVLGTRSHFPLSVQGPVITAQKHRIATHRDGVAWGKICTHALVDWSQAFLKVLVDRVVSNHAQVGFCWQSKFSTRPVESPYGPLGLVHLGEDSHMLVI